MKPQDAIEILKAATAAYRGTRDDHHNIQTALKVLQSLIPQDNPRPSDSEIPAEDKALPKNKK